MYWRTRDTASPSEIRSSVALDAGGGSGAATGGATGAGRGCVAGGGDTGAGRGWAAGGAGVITGEGVGIGCGCGTGGMTVGGAAYGGGGAESMYVVVCGVTSSMIIGGCSAVRVVVSSPFISTRVPVSAGVALGSTVSTSDRVTRPSPLSGIFAITTQAITIRPTMTTGTTHQGADDRDSTGRRAAAGGGTGAAAFAGSDAESARVTTAVPHLGQNRDPGGTGAPQTVQGFITHFRGRNRAVRGRQLQNCHHRFVNSPVW
jgi:hypothetical protein